MRTSSKAAGVLCLFALSGCSLIMEGTSQEVTFVSEPPGATFTIAGQTATTPATLELPKNEYKIVFNKDGYENLPLDLRLKMDSWFYGSLLMGPVSATVDMVTGAWKEFEKSEVRIRLQPLPGTVEDLKVMITSDPSAAEIVINGTAHGKTPKELWLAWRSDEKSKEVTLQLAQYKPKTVPLARGAEKVEATLDPIPLVTRVSFTSVPEGAEVLVDGRLEGRTPIIVSVNWLPNAPPKPVEMKKDGYRPWRAELIRDQAECACRLDEILEEAPLALKIFPAGAQIEVDGVRVGAGLTEIPLRWSVSFRRHTLKISHPGYATRTVDVDRSAISKPLEVRLAPVLRKVP